MTPIDKPSARGLCSAFESGCELARDTKKRGGVKEGIGTVSVRVSMYSWDRKTDREGGNQQS
jgi:hypothetical protein